MIVVEDEPLIQHRLAEILQNIGYTSDQLFFAENLAKANEILEMHSASIALVDLGLPDGNGIEFIKTLKNYDPTILILVISAWSTEDHILQAIAAGATGYVLKERDDLEVTLSIRSIIRGGAPIDPFIARKILQLAIMEDANKSLTKENTSVLTKREYEILQLVDKGLSNKEISLKLNLSKYTVESHVKHIYRKLEVCTRIKAVGVARDLGILE